MGTFSIWHWLVVLAVVLVLFGGRGKISSIMGDFGKGLKSFKKGMKDEDAGSEANPKTLADEPQARAAETSAEEGTTAKTDRQNG